MESRPTCHVFTKKQRRFNTKPQQSPKTFIVLHIFGPFKMQHISVKNMHQKNNEIGARNTTIVQNTSHINKRLRHWNQVKISRIQVEIHWKAQISNKKHYWRVVQHAMFLQRVNGDLPPNQNKRPNTFIAHHIFWPFKMQHLKTLHM